MIVQKGVTLADDYLWMDSPASRKGTLSRGSFTGVAWAIAAFVFVWIAEAIMAYWTVEETLGPSTSQFLEASTFLVIWTLLALFTTLYCLQKIRPAKAGAAGLTRKAILLPVVGGGTVAVALENVAGIRITLNKNPQEPEAGRYALVVTTVGGNTAGCELLNRAGLLAALKKGRWKNVPVNY
jgi:hypothetical protein